MLTARLVEKRIISWTSRVPQGRYKAILVDVDNYLLELVRYIHNNPVRAQLIYSQNTPLKQYLHYDILGVF